MLYKWVTEIALETKLEFGSWFCCSKNDKHKEEHIMNIDKIAPMAAVAISLIAAFVPFEYWGLLLIVIGLAHGLMSPVDDPATQAMIYAAAVAVPLMAMSFGDAIPAIGGIGEDLLINLTTAIHGYAIATLIGDIKTRVMG